MALFQSVKVGAVDAPNRLFMAPLTRIRATEYTHVPSDLMVEHYAARADAGLLIAEATMVQEGHSSFWREPGIYSEEQVAAWSKVTKAVHERGGRIFLQIWHGGRTVVPDNHKPATQPIAPSAIRVEKHHVAAHFNGTGEQIDYALPRALEDEELPTIRDHFVKAAKNAIAAGFDGVEIHGANGYLLDEFLRSGTNQRSAPYGGSLENRARFPLEVVDAVIAAIGAERVGYRISPLNAYTAMNDENPVALTAYIAKQLGERKIAYLHVMRADFYGPTTEDVLTPARENFSGVLVANMGYTLEEAEEAIAAGKVDAIAFGGPFLANPDLVTRAKTKAPLNQVNWMTVYGAGATGYNDYLTLEQEATANKVTA